MDINLTVSVIVDLSGIILPAFYFSVLSERLHAAVSNSIVHLDKQLRETIVLDIIRRNHGFFKSEIPAQELLSAVPWKGEKNVF